MSLLDMSTAESRANREAITQRNAGLLPPLTAEAMKVNPADRAWVDGKCTPHPFLTFKQGLPAVEAHERVERKVYVRATASPSPVFDRIANERRNRPGWRVVDLSFGHDVMVDAPQQVTDILVGALCNGGKKRVLCTASRSLAGLLATAHLSLSALAAEPIHLIVPTPPGSASDARGRAISTPWSQIGGRPVVIENVAGAGGTIGTARLVRSPNDGSTLAILSSNHSINPALYKKLPYDGLTDVTPIIMIGNIPSMLVASSGLEANTVADLIRLAQSGKKELVEGVVSGTSYQMASEIFKQHAGISTSRIPYKG